MMSSEEEESLRMKLDQKSLGEIKADLNKGIYGNGRGKKAFVEHYVKTQEDGADSQRKEQELGLQNEANQIAKQHHFISWVASGIGWLVSVIVAIFR